MIEEKKFNNNLRIALIKKDYTEFNQIIESKEMNSIGVNSNKTIYYVKYPPKEPKWVNSFFNDNKKLKELYSSNAKVLLLVKILITENENRIFAIFFGYGRSLMKKECIEDRFGLKVVLNSSPKGSIRKIKKTELVNNIKKCDEQMPSISSINDFEFNFDGDLIEEVTCNSRNNVYVKGTICGGDVLVLNQNVNIEKIDEFLLRTYNQYILDTYKENFEWIDNIKSIKDNELINKLNKELINLLNAGDEKIKMAVPDNINWERIDHFKYKNCDNEDDVYIKKIIDSYREKIESIEQLKKSRVKAIGNQNEEEINSWQVYECIVGEIRNDNKVYYITNGKWFEIKADFVEKINKEYENTPIGTVDFESFANKMDVSEYGEKEYNEDFVNRHSKDYLNLDRKVITLEHSYSKIEICDILSKDKKLIHVKQYHGSAVLSHLFNQGKVSATLLLEKDFLNKVNAKIEEVLKESGRIDQLNDFIINNPNEYEVIFAIIKYDESRLPDIPFFSKLTFCDTKRNLIKLKYNVSIETIRKN